MDKLKKHLQETWSRMEEAPVKKSFFITLRDGSVYNIGKSKVDYLYGWYIRYFDRDGSEDYISGMSKTMNGALKEKNVWLRRAAEGNYEVNHEVTGVYPLEVENG